MPTRLLSAALISAAGLLPALAHATPFYGHAYDLKSGKYLYTEVHQPKLEGERTVASTISYYAADGASLGKKTLDYRADPFVPTFKFNLNYNGYGEAIVSNSGGKIVLAKTPKGGAAEERKSIEKSGLIAADSGFHHLVQSLLPKLVAGETVPFRFAVAGQLDAYKFAIKKTGEGSFEGKPAVKLLVQANSLLKYLAPDLQLLYDATSKRLLEYKGVSNIHDPASGKAYTVRIIYPSKPPADAPKNLPPLS